MKKIALFFSILFIIIFCSFSITHSSEYNLDVNGSSFTINNEDTFLLGVSLFDFINLSDNSIKSDLDYLRENNFNLIRVWADWSWQNYMQGRYSTVFYKDGSLNSNIDKLKFIIDEADKRGMIVDVTIGDTNPYYFSDNQSLNLRLTATEEITKALIGKENVFFDICNEHDHTGTDFYSITHSEADNIIRKVREFDPSRIVTISSTGSHILDGDTLTDENKSNIDSEVQMEVNALTPHFARSSDWYSVLDSRINTVRNYLSSTNTQLPIYIQEEEYYPSDSNGDHFITSATSARSANAGGWIFHNLPGLELRNKYSFYDELGSEGRVIVESIGSNFPELKQCTCSGYEETSCGGGYCEMSEVQMIRTCNPSGCNLEETCAVRESCGGTSTEIFDNLKNSSSGLVSGGVFSDDGWRTTGETDHIDYVLSGDTTMGGYTFDVTGLNNSNWLSVTYDVYTFASLFDGTKIENASNPYHISVWGFGPNRYPDYFGKFRFRCNVNNQSGSDTDPRAFEEDSIQYNWNPSETYNIRIEWDQNTMYFYINNNLEQTWNYSSINEEFRPQSPIFRLGNMDYYTPKNITYSNLHVWLGESNPNPDINQDGIINTQDIGIMMSSWGNTNKGPSDLNQDGIVDQYDFALIVNNW